MSTSSVTPNPKYGAALTYVQQVLGYIVNEVESFPNILASAPTAPFLAGNADRVGLLLANTGANPIVIGLSQGVALANGFLLSAQGGAISFDARTDFTITTRAFWAFAVGALSSLYVLELIGVKSLPPGQFGGS